MIMSKREPKVKTKKVSKKTDKKKIEAPVLKEDLLGFDPSKE